MRLSVNKDLLQCFLRNGMTRPRIVDPGATLELSRRTTRRHFLLHPDEARQTEQVYWYCLAYAAKLHGVLVHAACLMSTRCHEVITDVRGEYPNFLETLHRNLALCTKAYRGWPEEVFSLSPSGPCGESNCAVLGVYVDFFGDQRGLES